jgi:hypothetical protein
MDMLSRVRLAALMVAVTALVFGCDGFETGTPPNSVVEEERTVVQFASVGASVGETDTATVTVELSTPQPVPNELSVEILFAEPSSSAKRADFGDAFPDDAPVRELTRTVTFAAGADDGTTQSVSFADLEDDVPPQEEGLETAIFKLQQLNDPSGRASIGENDRFDLLIGLLDIAGAREQGAQGNFIATQGIVTRAQGDFTRIQDETGGLVVRQTGGAFSEAVSNGDIRRGDLILVTGTTSFFSGLQQINEEELSDFTVVSRDNPLPEPAVVTVEELLANGEEYESELVRVEGLTTDATGTFSGSTSYTVSDGTGSMTLRTPNAGDTEIVGKDIPGGSFVFEGPLGQFNGGFDGADEPDSGYQLAPVARGDVFVPGQ